MFDSLRKALRKLRKRLRLRPRDKAAVFEIVGDFNYLELAARCPTQNKLNRLHIGLENVCTPRELAEIDKLARSRREFEATRLWLKKYQMWTPELFDRPQDYGRRTISRHVILYQSPEREACNKDLLVAFAGNARRLMMPVSVFLQFLDCRLWDVAVFKKCTRNSYLLGLEGISADFPGLVDFIETTLAPTKYRRVITLGTSGGGFAAILAARLMGAERGISIGGSLPKVAQSSTIGKQRASDRPDLCFVYASESAVDHQSALALLRFFGGRLCPVPGTSHNPIGSMMKNGQFGDFIEEMLA